MSHEQPSPLARYLFAAYALLVVYASLHPFSGWRDQGVAPFAFLLAPLPRYVPNFDVVANFVGYLPLGFLAVLAAQPRLRGGAAFTLGAACAFLLSFLLEALQLYLPSRIASNLDLIANAVGGATGALVAIAAGPRLLREQGLQGLRRQLFLRGGRVDLGLVLLGLWLLSQFHPGTLLFGVGDLRELFQTPSGKLYPAELFLRVEAGVAGANVLAAGLLASCLVAAAQLRRLLTVSLVVTALAVRAFAFGLLLGADNVLLWATPGALYGTAAGIVLLLIVVALPRTAQLALAGAALLAGTALVNLAPENPYLTASLALWRQGYFLNFNGLTRVVSAAWPFAAMIYLVSLAGERERK